MWHGWYMPLLVLIDLFAWAMTALISVRNARGFKLGKQLDEQMVASNLALSATTCTLSTSLIWIIDASTSEVNGVNVCGVSYISCYAFGWILFLLVSLVFGPVVVGLNFPYGAGPHAPAAGDFSDAATSGAQAPAAAAAPVAAEAEAVPQV